MLKSKRYRLLFFYLLIANFALGQELVKDINPNTFGQADGGYFADLCKPCGNYIYFEGRDSRYGRELWRTDGTTAGTQRISDFAQDPDAWFLTNSTCANKRLNFNTKAGAWQADGDVLTKLSDNKIVAVARGERIYVDVQDENSSVFLNQTLLKKFTPNSGFDNAFIYDSKADGDKLYLAVAHTNSTTVSTEAWVWADNNFTLLHTSDEYFNTFIAVNDILYFDGKDVDHGKEMWTSDGTVEGTMMLDDGKPGADGSDPLFVKAVDNKVIYVSEVKQRGTWATSGTPASTSLIFPGYVPQFVTKYHDKIYFSGGDVLANIGLSRTDLDFTNVEELTPQIPSGYTGSFTIVNDKLLHMRNSNDYGMELFQVHDDGSVTLLKDIFPGIESSEAGSFADLGTRSVFVANDGTHHFEWWSTDGTEANTFMLEDIATGTLSPDMSEVYQYDKKLYFIANSTGTQQHELWRSDGTDAGTYPIFSDPALSKDMLFGINQYVITTANGFVKIDVEAEDATPLALPDGYTNYVEIHAQPGLSIGDIVYFNTAAGPSPDQTGGLELWKADVSTNEITFVKDINPGPEGSVIYADKPKFNGMGVVLGNKIIFPAETSDGMEPWVSDGTEEGTIMLKNIRGSGDSFPKSFTVVGDKVFFIALSDEQGTELWITDGTPEGTHIVKDIAPGDIDGVLNEPLAVYGDLFFTATTDGNPNNNKLWISDGTEEGTMEYDNLLPAGWSNVQYPVASGDYLYFLASHPDHGSELWSTDGTVAGTTLIEITPGKAGSLIDDFITSNGTLYFSTHGKIWRSLGTPETTVFLGEANPVSELMLTENYLCFLLDDPQYGRELFRVSLTGPVGQLITFNGFTDLQPGQEYTFSVTASSGLPVTLTSSDPSVIEISGNKLIVHKPGTVTFSASQGGDVDFNPSSETLTVVIPRLTQTLTFEAIANKTMLDAPFDVVASSSAGLHVMFESSDATIADISTEGKITIKKAGTVTITASQPGTEIYDAVTPISRTFTISKVGQDINFDFITTKIISDGSILLAATSTSGLAVAYTSTSNHISIVGNAVSFISPGQVSITASQPGNDIYNAATPVTRSFCINPLKPVVTQTALGADITLTSSANTNVWLLDNNAISQSGKSFKATEPGFYKAAETVEGCQGEFSEPVEVAITGLEDESSPVVVYPNPVSKTLFIKSGSVTSVRILDLNGREKYNQSIGDNTGIDVSDYASGIYILILNNTQHLKFIKQ